MSIFINIKSSEDMAYIEKRTAHNALERQRREGLNSKFQELAHVLPALQQIRRPSKSMIVAKSLEFGKYILTSYCPVFSNLYNLVSSAVERQTDFEDQLDALRVENAQLLRQAEISTKRIKKQVETDHTTTTKNGKQPLATNKSTSIIKSRRLPSKMKPQLRQSSLPISIKPSVSLTPKIAEGPASAPESDASEIKHQMKRSRDDIDGESIGSGNISPSTSAIKNTNEISQSSSETTNNKKRRRNYTTEITSNIKSNIIDNNHKLQHQQSSHRHNRYSSHQPSSSAATILDDLDNIISPAQSRQNSITAITDQLPLIYDSNDNETLIVPTQFDIATTSTSPFGTEHTYFNTYENFEHVVSSIPALRTPVGRSNSTDAASITQLPPPYDHTSLDILNSLMQEHQNLDAAESKSCITIF